MKAAAKSVFVIVACAVLASITVFSGEGEPSVTVVDADERVVFLTTDARLSADRQHWIVPIHAWVYEFERSSIRKRAVAALLKQKYGLEPTADTQQNFDDRMQLFLLDNERGKRVVLRLAGKSFALPPTGANGHVRQELEIDAKLIEKTASNGVLEFFAILDASDKRSFAGRVNLVSPTGVSVISDIDDTVKDTRVTDRRELFDRTMFRGFEAVPGMADLYHRWARQGAAFHYVSSSPWQLYEPLDDFLTEQRFPPRSLSLRLIRLKDRTIQNLFKKGTHTKPRQIEPILNAYPQRRFILVGDSGEQDPEVYAEILKEHPDQVAHIFIRNVTDAFPESPRFRKTFAGIEPTKWTLFTDPSQLKLPKTTP